MELRLQKNEFIKTLAWTQSVVERKSAMPILANCLLDAKGKNVTVSATDLEVAVVVDQVADVVHPGKVTIPARGLFDIVKELPDERFTLKVLPNFWVEVTSGKSRFKVVGMSPEEFPNLPAAEKGDAQTILAEQMHEMIEKVAYAISTDEARFNLNGVFLEVVDGESPQLRCVATDSHRLSYAERPVKGKWRLAKGVIVPRKGVFELRKLLEGTDDEFTLQVGTKHVSVTKGPVTLMIRLIEGQFPPYQQVIPKDHAKVVGVERQALLQALRRVQLLTTDRSRGVIFSVSSGHLGLRVNNPDLGEAEEELTAQYKGETFKWACNCRYLSDALNAVEDEQALLELKNEVSPCIIRSEFDRGFLAVVMPMRI